MPSNITINNPTWQEVSKAAKGRLLATVVADIVNTRNIDKLPEKANLIASVANNFKIIKRRFIIQEKARDALKIHQNRHISGCKIIISAAFPYACLLIDGLSKRSSEHRSVELIIIFSGEDEVGTTIMFSVRKELQNMKTHYACLIDAATHSTGFGFKMNNGIATADNNVAMEAQVYMEFTNAETCYVVFVNASNLDDTVICKVEKRNHYFQNKVQQKLMSFIEQHFLKAVANKNIIPYKPA